MHVQVNLAHRKRTHRKLDSNYRFSTRQLKLDNCRFMVGVAWGLAQVLASAAAAPARPSAASASCQQSSQVGDGLHLTQQPDGVGGQ